MCGACSTHGKDEKCKIPREKPTHGWENNIRMDPKDIAWEDVDWICLAQDRDQWRALVSMVKKLRVK
jgi:hypothetical protein